MNNRMWNVQNPNQGDYKKVLCICSAGLLRSPTTALVLSQEPFNFNTRACGIDEGHALIVLDDVLLAWADEIVVMDAGMERRVKERTDKPIICLNIADSYDYRSPELIALVKERYPK